MKNVLPIALTCVVAVTAAASARAQSTFHVKEFDYGQGKWVFESINAVHDGFPARADRLRHGHELGLGYGVTSWWLPKVLVSFDRMADGGDLVAQRVLLENIVTLKPLIAGQDGIGVALFHSVEGAIRHGETNFTQLGPIITAHAGRLSATANIFLGKTFGQNREPGADLFTAWQARYAIADKLKLGVEGYLTIPELGTGASAGAGTQHLIGPVLIIETELAGGPRSRAAGGTMPPARAVAGSSANGPHAELEIGVLFGTTDATQDVVGKANMHVKF